jgi:hypothetical protein
MHQWAGIALGLVIIIALIVLYMSRSSGFEPTPVDVVPTQLPVVPDTPPTPVMEPSPVIDHQYVSNTIPVTDMDSFPESMSFTSLKVTSEIGSDEMPAQTPTLVKFSGPAEDIEMETSTKYSEWSP